MTGLVQYEIEHVSRYSYASPVRNCVMTLCLEPRNDLGQRLLRFDITTDPLVPLNGEMDSFGNTKHVLNVHREHEALEVTARSTVELTPAALLPDSLGADAWGEIGSWKESFGDWDFTHPSEFTRPSPALASFVDGHGIATPGGDPLRALVELSDTLHSSFEYVPGSTSVISPIDHILESGQGVCQDYAHVMIAVARAWGVPTRYVSGYFHVAGAPRATATHAWVECRLPELGWVGFDPTNRSIADERHVRVAVGRDYGDVAPTRGVFQGVAETRLEVDIVMTPRPVG
jgi:transglutaminase-like putative cysteine protease